MSRGTKMAQKALERRIATIEKAKGKLAQKVAEYDREIATLRQTIATLEAPASVSQAAGQFGHDLHTSS